MKYDIDAIKGLVFPDPQTGEEYGCIRATWSDDRTERVPGWTSVAEDGCGNAFVVSTEGAVAFWDHETDEVTPLAPTWSAFVDGCRDPEPVDVDAKVLSVWIDPEFAEEHGIDVDENGRPRG